MNKLVGLKTSLVSIFMVLATFIVVTTLPSFLQFFKNISVNQLALLMGLSFLFACQFNHSRFALIILMFSLLLVVDDGALNAIVELPLSPELIHLTVIFFFGGLVFYKERSLLSVHSFSRILLFIFAYLAAYGWLAGVNYIKGLELAAGNISLIEPYLALELPLLIVALIIVVKSLRNSHLLYPAILVTLFIGYITVKGLISLPWQVTLTLLISYYLLSVIASSYFLAYRDELTGLPSRRALNQLALSLGRNYSVAMMDVDHFKKFNDTYGHDIGDQVLKLVAAKLKRVKAGGRVFRYGGEEFTVVFPRKKADVVFNELDDLRQAIADYQMVIRQGDRKTKKQRQGKTSSTSHEKLVSVTISIGVSQRQSGQTFEQVLKSADELLYKAKKKGRNNVSM